MKKWILLGKQYSFNCYFFIKYLARIAVHAFCARMCGSTVLASKDMLHDGCNFNNLEASKKGRRYFWRGIVIPKIVLGIYSLRISATYSKNTPPLRYYAQLHVLLVFLNFDQCRSCSCSAFLQLSESFKFLHQLLCHAATPQTIIQKNMMPHDPNYYTYKNIKNKSYKKYNISFQN